jgi:hypothetical protein
VQAFCFQPVFVVLPVCSQHTGRTQHSHMYGLVGQPMACTATLQTRLPVNLEAVSVFPKEHKELVNVLCSLTASPEEMLSHHASTAQAGHDVAGGWRAESVATGDDYCRLEI